MALVKEPWTYSVPFTSHALTDLDTLRGSAVTEAAAGKKIIGNCLQAQSRMFPTKKGVSSASVCCWPQIRRSHRSSNWRSAAVYGAKAVLIGTSGKVGKQQKTPPLRTYLLPLSLCRIGPTGTNRTTHIQYELSQTAHDTRAGKNQIGIAVVWPLRLQHSPIRSAGIRVKAKPFGRLRRP